jgi:hypothetical protein
MKPSPFLMKKLIRLEKRSKSYINKERNGYLYHNILTFISIFCCYCYIRLESHQQQPSTDLQ